MSQEDNPASPTIEYAYVMLDPQTGDALYRINPNYKPVAASDPDILRRIVERGLRLAQERGSEFIDLFQHMLDEIARQPKPVAAQEPVACGLVGRIRYRKDGGVSHYKAGDCYVEWATTVIAQDGHPLYANAAPCARCAELEREKFDWKKEFGEDRAENIELQAKITEQAARINALESECRKLRDALSETEAFCKRKDITIERQRKVVKLSGQALTEVQDLIAESRGVYGLHLNGDKSPWNEIEQGGWFERLVTLPEALSAIAELEKGVGG